MTNTANLDQPRDRWISRARPSFLYVMYAVILFALPVGMMAAFRPTLAAAVSEGVTGYLSAIPDALWTVFVTGYLGYTAARQWGKIKGVDL